MTRLRADNVTVDRIPGWFKEVDRALFRFFLSTQVSTCQRGGLVELGAYLGKSAVVIGDYVQPSETFTVVDLFGYPSADPSNAAENLAEYGQLTQSEFERNYLAVHPNLPSVYADYSQNVVLHVPPASQRFVHIDASHLYEHVRGDIAAARSIVQEQAVVVLDDIRSPHTPGVAAAAWQEVTTGDLQPLLITRWKLYATFSDAEPWLARLGSWLSTSGLPHEAQVIAGKPIWRIGPVHTNVKAGRSVRGLARGLVPPLALQAAKAGRKRWSARRS